MAPRETNKFKAWQKGQAPIPSMLVMVTKQQFFIQQVSNKLLKEADLTLEEQKTEIFRSKIKFGTQKNLIGKSHNSQATRDLAKLSSRRISSGSPMEVIDPPKCTSLFPSVVESICGYLLHELLQYKTSYLFTYSLQGLHIKFLFSQQMQYQQIQNI